jgi:ROS/MUCR transcriptional regulator protein
LTDLADEKVSFFDAAIVILSPLAGLRPSRLGVVLTLNFPKPGSETSAPLAAASTALCALAPNCDLQLETRSGLFENKIAALSGPDLLICLDDGKRFKSLRRHLTRLGLTPEQYREKWNLPFDYPMVAPNYAASDPR